MAENNDAVWAAQFQFDASSAVVAKAAVNGFVDVLGRLVQQGALAEQTANRIAKALLVSGKSAQTSAAAFAAGEKSKVAALNGTAAAVERNARLQRTLISDVNTTKPRNVDTGRFQKVNTSTYTGAGVMPNIKTLPGLANSTALAVQKSEELASAEAKVTAASEKAAAAQRALASQLRTAASAKGVLSSSISSGTNNFASGGLLQAIPQIKALRSATEGLVLPMSSVSARAEELQKTMGNFYPLLVAAGVFGAIGTALTAFDVQVIKTAADYQTAFAQVSRTTDSEGQDVEAQLATIRQGLLDLSTTTPVDFVDLAGIATLGNQLGVAGDQILSFTKTVAEFSAVTGVSSEQTAKSFGALGQIFKLSSQEYDQFGSAITYVGRKSVATEAEIVTLTERLGATAANAGFTAQQVVGLSGALASLREAPERSQGAFELFFKTINNAAANGGKRLDEFGKLIGKTSDETADLIKNDPHAFFQAFLEGLSKLDHTGQTVALGKLGLSGIRVSEVMQRLANNLDLVNKIEKDAESGFADGTDLSDQYAKSTDTLNAQFQELVNSVGNLMDALGNSGALNGLTVMITLLKDVVVNVTAFAQANPVFTSMALGITAVVGVLFLLRAAMIAAQIATMALADARLAASSAQYAGTLRTLVGLLLGEGVAAKQAAASTTVLTVASGEAAVSQTVLGRAIGGVQAAFTGASVGARVFRVALASTGIGLAIVAFGALAEAMMNTKSAGEGINNDALGAALRKDQAEYVKSGSAIKMLNVEVDKSGVAAKGWVAGLEQATGAQVTLNGRTSDATKTIDKQTVAYGTNAKAAIASSLANDQAFQKLFSGGALSKLDSNGSGFNSKTYIQRLLGDPKDAERYIEQYQNALQTKLTRLGAAKLGGTQPAIDLKNQIDALGTLKDYASNADGALQQAASSNAALGAVAAATGIDVTTLAGGLDDASDSADGASDSAQTLTDQYGAMVTTIFAGVNAAYAQAQAMFDMGQAFVENGAAAAFSGQSIQDYITSVIAAAPTSQDAADTLQALANGIVGAGYAANLSAPSLSYLNQVIAGLGGSDTKAAAPMLNFRSGMQKAYAAAKSASGGISGVGTAAEKAAKKVRTLTDYASDLTGVFNRSFSLRFDAQSSRDDIASQFQDMQDSAKDAAKAIQDAKDKIKSIRAEIAKLKADNQQQAYFLSVAQQFGDGLRAGQIQAQIDSNNSDIAGKRTDLSDAKSDKSKAEDEASTNLKGNTKGAIENRKALRDLTDKYKDYIGKLAESGLNQKELTKKVAEAKKKFMEQAESLGYSKRQLTPYISSFDDLIQIIAKVPRKITVSANADPAIQALKEFEAKAAETAANVKKSLGGKNGITVPPLNVEGGAATGALKMALKAEIAYIKARLQSQTDNFTKTSNAANQDFELLRNLEKKLSSFSSGGYTGPGGKYQPAGIVHRGEYVIPKHQVNQSTGLPYADALGRLVKGAQGRQHYAGGGYVDPGMGIVELGPASMRVLRSAVHTEVKAVISAEKTASAVNSVNSNRRRRGGDGR